MNFKIKSLVAAVAMVAAGQAFAAIELPTNGMPNTDITVGGSEVVFYAWDDATATSFTFDTGLKMADFRPSSAAANSSFSYTFASLANASSAWSSYMTSVGGDLSNTTWGLAALRAGSAGGVQGSVTVLTTVRDNQDLVDLTQKSGALKSISGFLTPTLTIANGAGHAAAENFTGDYAIDGEDNYWGTSVQHKLGGKLVTEADNYVGSTAYNFYEVQALTSNGALAQVTPYAGQWTFNGTTLAYTVAAVPEPETYAMLLAGLGLIGAVARRRAAK